MTREYMTLLTVGLVGCIPTVPWLTERLGKAGTLVGRIAAPVFLALALMQLAAGSHSPFIYAQF